MTPIPHTKEILIRPLVDGHVTLKVEGENGTQLFSDLGEAISFACALPECRGTVITVLDTAGGLSFRGFL